MIDADIRRLLMNAVDGQIIRVTLASGRTIDGVFNGEQTSYEAGLYFETLEGNPLRADWINVTDVGFRSARAVAGRMFVPDGHPASGQGPVGVTATGVPRRPHTSRNR